MQHIIHAGDSCCEEVLHRIAVTDPCKKESQHSKNIVPYRELDYRNIGLPLFCQAEEREGKGHQAEPAQRDRKNVFPWFVINRKQAYRLNDECHKEQDIHDLEKDHLVAKQEVGCNNYHSDGNSCTGFFYQDQTSDEPEAENPPEYENPRTWTGKAKRAINEIRNPSFRKEHRRHSCPAQGCKHTQYKD